MTTQTQPICHICEKSAPNADCWYCPLFRTPIQYQEQMSGRRVRSIDKTATELLRLIASGADEKNIEVVASFVGHLVLTGTCFGVKLWLASPSPCSCSCFCCPSCRWLSSVLGDSCNDYTYSLIRQLWCNLYYCGLGRSYPSFRILWRGIAFRLMEHSYCGNSLVNTHHTSCHLIDVFYNDGLCDAISISV